mgnify:CR=1 FL=1
MKSGRRQRLKNLGAETEQFRRRALLGFLGIAVATLAMSQLAAGLVNLLLLVPIWMQLVHLLLADALWLSLVLLTVSALATERRTA